MGLHKLDHTERRIEELADKQREMATELAQLKISHEHEISQLMISLRHSLSIRDRFFGAFLRDHIPSKYSSGEHKKKVKGEQFVHHWAPQLDALFYTNHIRSDESTFIILYGVPPDSIALLSKSK